MFDNTRVNIVLDHFVPNKDIKSATQSKQCREFADKYDILNFSTWAAWALSTHCCLNRAS